MSPPTKEEVAVLLQLYEMTTRPEMRAARTWMLTEFDAANYEEFQSQYPAGSTEWRHFTDVCGIMELFGVLLKHEVLGEDLLFDLFGGIDVLWNTVAGVVPEMRAAIDPRLYENFEQLSARYRSWQARQQA